MNISELVKTVIADLPRHRERAGWPGLLLSCSFRHNSLFTGGLWTVRRLSGGSGGKGSLQPHPLHSGPWPAALSDESCGAPCQDAQGGCRQLTRFPHQLLFMLHVLPTCHSLREGQWAHPGCSIGRHLEPKGKKSGSCSGLLLTHCGTLALPFSCHILSLSILKSLTRLAMIRFRLCTQSFWGRGCFLWMLRFDTDYYYYYF